MYSALLYSLKVNYNNKNNIKYSNKNLTVRKKPNSRVPFRIVNLSKK